MRTISQLMMSVIFAFAGEGKKAGKSERTDRTLRPFALRHVPTQGKDLEERKEAPVCPFVFTW